MRTKSLFTALFLIAFFGISMTSCNSNTDKNQAIETPKYDAEFAQSDTIEIQLEGNDKMQFNKTEIVVYEGQTVTLTLTHVGSMPRSAMGHNFVLIAPEISISEYAKKATKAKANDYVLDDSTLTLAHTEMIGGGERTTITFQAPEKGSYDFLCSFPGHYSIMKGKLFVL